MLKKLFIKNYKNINDSSVRNKYGIVAGTFGIISNLILGIIKIIIGILSNSISIIVDAINNISDMATSVLTIIGFKLSSKKPDKEHPYGHARYEYIFGLLIAIFMFIMGVLFARESIIKIINPVELKISMLTFIILVISIILKVIQMIVYLDFSKAIKSKTLKTNAIDTRNDILTTSIIFISLVIMYIFNINIDGYLGTFVSLFVIISSIKQIIEVIQPLVGIPPSKEQVKQIKNKLLSYDYVIGIHDLAIHNYGVNNDFITVHIELDSRLSLIEAHDLIDVIENDIKEKYGTEITIHIDPVIVGDKKIDKLKSQILTELKKLDKKIEIHDFRVIEGKKKDKILFDCVIPYEKDYTYNYLKKYLSEKITNDNKTYVFFIEIDRPYC